MKQLTLEESYGPAPDVTDLDPELENYETRLLPVFNWLNAATKPEELKEFALRLLMSEDKDIDNLEILEPYYFSSYGAIAWIRLNGGKWSERLSLKWNEGVLRLNKIGQKKIEEKGIEETMKPKPISQETLFHRVRNVVEDLFDDGKFDDNENSVYLYLLNYKTKSTALNLLADHFNTAFDEYAKARTEEFAEYFEGVSDSEIDSRKRFYLRVMADIASIQQNKSAKRVVRTRKNGSHKIAKKVKNVNFKTDDAELKIVSIDPISVVGSQALITYNTKTKRLAMFVARTRDGLSIRGTTIHGYDDELSLAKTLRKPAEQLPSFRAATTPRRAEIVLKENIKGKEFGTSGRLNKDTLLLKAFK